MFKLKEKITGVTDFDLLDGRLYYLRNDKSIVDNRGDEVSTGIDSDHIGEIFAFGTYLIWQDGRGKSMVYDIHKKVTVFENVRLEPRYTFRRSNIYKNKIIAVVRERGKKSMHFFDLKKKAFSRIFLNEFQVSITSKDGCLFTLDIDREHICLLNNRREAIWRHKIKGEFTNIRGENKQKKIKNILGIFNNILWILINSNEIVGIDTNEGAEKIFISIDENLDFNTMPFKFQLDKETGLLIGASNNYFSFLDIKEIKEGKLKWAIKKDILEENLNISYRKPEFPVNSNLIFYCDDRTGQIGVFDIDRMVKVWSDFIDVKKEGISLIMDMKVYNESFYVLDRFNTLHRYTKI